MRLNVAKTDFNWPRQPESNWPQSYIRATRHRRREWKNAVTLAQSKILHLNQDVSQLGDGKDEAELSGS